MIPASDLKTGMILRIEKNLYKVMVAEYHLGGGKMGGLVHAKLKDLQEENKTILAIPLTIRLNAANFRGMVQET